MKFALVNGNKAKAYNGAVGICPICGSNVFARCGVLRAGHCSHKGKSNGI